MLRFPLASWLAAVLAAGLALPSVFADFYCDDQGMVLRLEGQAPGAAAGPFGLYKFVPGAPGPRREFVDHGPLPWWTSDDLRLSFFRPLSSGLFALDHILWGRHPLPCHLHSIAWYLAAIAAVAALLRRLLDRRCRPAGHVDRAHPRRGRRATDALLRHFRSPGGRSVDRAHRLARQGAPGTAGARDRP